MKLQITLAGLPDRGSRDKTDIWDFSYLFSVAVNFFVNLRPIGSPNVKLKFAIWQLSRIFSNQKSVFGKSVIKMIKKNCQVMNCFEQFFVASVVY